MYGDYSCRTELSPNDRVNFTLRPPKSETLTFTYICTYSVLPKNLYMHNEFKIEKTLLLVDFQVAPRLNPMRLHPNEQLNVSCEANDDFIMVSLPEELPVVTNRVVPVESRPHEYKHYKYRGTFLSGHLKPRDSGYISCNWKSSNLTFAQWQFSVTDQGQLHSQHSLTFFIITF